MLGDLLHYRLTFASLAGTIWKGRTVLVDHLRSFPDDLLQLPDPGEPPLRDLHMQMLERAGAEASRDPRTLEQRKAELAARQRGPLKPWEA